MSVQVIPYLCIKNAASAIDFYKKAFGATETFARITDSTGRVGHAEIQIGASTIMLADEHPEIGEVTDPFSYRWTLSTKVEDVSEEEMLRRAADEEKKRKAR